MSPAHAFHAASVSIQRQHWSRGIILAVPVPPFRNGVLPPLLLKDSPVPEDMSPHRATMSEVVEALGRSGERADLIRGLLDVRRRLREEGVTEGWQWICGSFVEECEEMRGRAPGDIDVVTFGDFTVLSDNASKELLAGKHTKEIYGIDSMAVDLVSLRHDTPYALKTVTHYLQFLSHTRANEWKGVLEVDLSEEEDIAALSLLGGTNG
jgi:hypothetical protein